MLHGWIDNASELAAALRARQGDPAALYAAAVARWGEDADARIHGCYAAIVHCPDASLRLSRSPWRAPPLYRALYRALHEPRERTEAGGGWIASPLLRVLFAGGIERRADWTKIADELACIWPDGGADPPFTGIKAVRLGEVVTLRGQDARARSWYELPVPMADRDYREADAVEKARGLLDEAVAAARRWSGAPALALSAGLDSPLVAASWARQAGEGERLDCFTFVPDARWRGETAPGTFGDDSEGVRALAARYPALRCRFTRGDVGAFDREARSLQHAMQLFVPGLANVGMMHELHSAARAAGARELWSADLGNTTFSADGVPAYCEYARPGRLGQLRRLLAGRAGDDRSLMRKFLALSVLPRLPRSVRSRLRAAVHPQAADFVAHQTLLRPGALGERAARSAWADLVFDTSRAGEVARAHEAEEGRGADFDLAMEERYGIVRRDVTAYRPLIEFCLSLPTRAFAWDGMDRRLARRMGEGLLPEEIRANRSYGRHNADWHERIAADRERLIEAFRHAGDHPALGAILDTDRIVALLEDWPDAPVHDYHRDWPLRLGIPRALVAVRFAGMLDDRNDL